LCALRIAPIGGWRGDPVGVPGVRPVGLAPLAPLIAAPESVATARLDTPGGDPDRKSPGVAEALGNEDTQ